MTIQVTDWFGMNVGNVLAITENVYPPYGENVVIAYFGATGRRAAAREDYDDDTDAFGQRRLADPPTTDAPTFIDGHASPITGNYGTLHLTHALTRSYLAGANVLVIAVDVTTIVGGDPITRYGSESIKFWLPNFE